MIRNYGEGMVKLERLTRALVDEIDAPAFRLNNSDRFYDVVNFLKEIDLFQKVMHLQGNEYECELDELVRLAPQLKPAMEKAEKAIMEHFSDLELTFEHRVNYDPEFPCIPDVVCTVGCKYQWPSAEYKAFRDALMKFRIDDTDMFRCDGFDLHYWT